MTTGYNLPTTITAGGKEYPIRTDFRAVLDVLIAMNDNEIDERGRALVVMKIMLPTWRDIPREHINEAIERAIEFIDIGETSENSGKPRPRLVDWEQDAALIIPAVNAVAHTEVRALPYCHWWTFYGYYMAIEGGVFGTVVGIRAKKAKHEKLDKWEREFARENRDIVEIKRKETAEEKAARESIEKWL